MITETQRNTETLRRKAAALVVAGAAAAASLATPADATAQSPISRIAGEGFGWVQLAAPLGEFDDYVGLGAGVGLGGLLFLGPQSHAALRLEGSFVVYGGERVRTPLSPTIPFVDVEVETTNSIVSLGLGPQIYLLDGPLRPYVFGTVGLSYFGTQTSVYGDYQDEPIASTTNHSDLSLTLTGGGGMSVRLYTGDVSFNLDLSAVYNRNGLTEYLTPGRLRQVGGGAWVADPIVSDANLVTYRIGVSFGRGRSNR